MAGPKDRRSGRPDLNLEGPVVPYSPPWLLSPVQAVSPATTLTLSPPSQASSNTLSVAEGARLPSSSPPSSPPPGEFSLEEESEEAWDWARKMGPK